MCSSPAGTPNPRLRSTDRRPGDYPAPGPTQALRATSSGRHLRTGDPANRHDARVSTNTGRNPNPAGALPLASCETTCPSCSAHERLERDAARRRPAPGLGSDSAVSPPRPRSARERIPGVTEIPAVPPSRSAGRPTGRGRRLQLREANPGVVGTTSAKNSTGSSRPGPIPTSYAPDTRPLPSA
jgi:hypothetical protein